MIPRYDAGMTTTQFDSMSLSDTTTIAQHQALNFLARSIGYAQHAANIGTLNAVLHSANDTFLSAPTGVDDHTDRLDARISDTFDLVLAAYDARYAALSGTTYAVAYADLPTD